MVISNLIVPEASDAILEAFPTTQPQETIDQITPTQPPTTNIPASEQLNLENSSPIQNKWQKLLILLSLFLCLFLAALDFTIATTALPTVTSAFHSSTGYTWIGSSYLLASAASTPIWGKLSDIFGRKHILLLVIVIFAVGSVVCASAKSMEILLVGRCVQGAAAGGVICLVNVCISDLFCLRDRGFYLGLTGVVWGLASGTGPLLGGALTEYVSWRWNWWINLPCCCLSFLVLCFSLPNHRSNTNLWKALWKIDWLGILAVLGLSIMTLLGLNFGGVFAPWSSPKVLCLITFGILVGFVFLLYEAKLAKDPLIPMRILYRLSNNASLLVCFTHGFVNVSSWYFLPLYFQASRSFTPFRSGLLLIPITVVQALTGVVAGYTIRRTGTYIYLIYTGMFLSTLGFSLFILLSPSTPLSLIITFEVLAGIGIGLVFQPPLIALQSSVSNSDLAVATSLFGFIRSLSTSTSIVIGGIVFQNGMQTHNKNLLMTPANLTPSQADLFSGTKAAANVNIIKGLTTLQQEIVKKVYSESLSRMWILYACVASLGLVLSFGIERKRMGEIVDEEKEKERGISRG